MAEEEFFPQKNGWYVVERLGRGETSARLAEMGLVPGVRVWLGVASFPAGVVYVHTPDGALVVRRSEIQEVRFIPLNG
ncbi:MAG: ferrous iron transport protein A [Flavobacteriales bacterium]|nr:ferrous iron transport protein A [Flavobacteriales bacterium]